MFENGSRIPQYLRELLSTLENQLANPKNTWKRREELQTQINDAQKRLLAIESPNRRNRASSDRDYPQRKRSQRPIQRV